MDKKNENTPQPQHADAADIPDVGTAPAIAGAEVPTAQSQTTTAAPDQPENSSQHGMKIEGMASIKLGNSELLYGKSWLRDAEQWFERLKNEVPWSPERVMMYGKPLVLKRETCNYGNDYDYNKLAKPAVPWGGPVLELKKMLEEATGRVFSQCACNVYPDGETGIGLHHDKRHPSLVASISFGAVRTIGFAPKGGKLDKSLPMIPLASGSLLLFTDAVNENYKHTIIEDKSVLGPRISVTLREFPAIEKEGNKVTRQMSPNSAPRTITAPEFQSVSDFVEAYKTTDKTIADLTGKFVDAAEVAKQKQDDILPHLAHMQALLSKKGANHGLVIEARKQGNKIPWWTEYYETYKDQLWESLRTMERRIAGYRKDPSVGTTKPRKDKKAKHLTHLEHKLLGTAANAREVIVDLRAGRIDEAIAKLDNNTPTQDRIEEHLERGVRPTLANPNGVAKPTDELEPTTTATADELTVALPNEPMRPSSAVPAGALMPQTVTSADWKNHHLPAPDFKLKYFAEASGDFQDRYYYAFQSSAFKKILDMLNDKPRQVISNSHDFTQLAVVLRGAADNLTLLVSAIATALALRSPEPSPEPVNQQEKQDAQQDVSDPAAFLNQEPEPEIPNSAAHVEATLPSVVSDGEGNLGREVKSAKRSRA